MDPQAPSQPSQQTVYNQSNNPTTQTASESSVASSNTTTTSQQPIDHRQPHDVPSTHSNQPTPSSLGYGTTGPLKEIPIPASDAQNYSKSELDGEQMRAPGEGDVADAVTEKRYGGHGEQAGLTEKMAGKAEGHKAALHEMGLRTGAEINEGTGIDGGGGGVGGTGVLAGDSTTTRRKTVEGAEVDLGEALGGRGGGVVLAPDQ